MAQAVEKVIGGKYEILEKIREGGMGAIYKVRHRLLDEVRVIKVLRSELAMDESLRQRFQNEAKFAIKLRHPNIAHLYDFSVSPDGTSAFIVMEYIEGVTLQELITQSGAPTVGLSVEIAVQSVRAISYLHQQGYVHRDIAGDNLMLTRDFEGNPLVKLIDLGIAKGRDESLNLTSTGMFMGKVRYSPPELFKAKGGAVVLDERSDIYSFGILLYELLTGKSPVEGDSFSEIVAGHLFRPPVPFETSDPSGEVPEGLRELTLRALEKDPKQRVASADELIAGLTRFLAAESESHADEFERAVEATTQLATIKKKAADAGSTQNRLDKQFGVEDPSSHPEELEEQRGEAVAQAVSAIREATVIGERSRASEDLELAVSLYGEHPEFESLRLELDETPEVEAAPLVEPGVDAPSPAAGSFLRSPLGVLLLAGVALLIAGLFLIGRFTGSTNGSSQDSVAAPSVERAPRWGEGESGGSESDRIAGTSELVPPPFGPEAQADPATAKPPAAESPRGPARSTSQRSSPRVEAPSEPTPRGSPEVQSPTRPDVSRGELFGPDPGVTPPSLIRVPAVVYPERFDAPRKTVEVMVDLLVSEDGTVITGRVGPREPAKRRYKEMALEVARGAVFRPATKYGVQGKMWTTIRIELPPR